MQFEALCKLNPRVRSLHKGVLVPDDTCLSLNASGLPVAELHLKVGCSVIILRNIDTK
jgi:hypothetical protein